MIDSLAYYCNFHENTVPFRNLAVEEYLLETVRPGQCILFLWQNRHTVVIGRNQNAWAQCRVSQLEGSGGYLVRRLSGGGAVYHDLGNLNFTFLVRKEDYDVSRQLDVILDAVRAFGLEAVRSGRNDLEIGGQKFSGNAFYESGSHCYHHGTLLVNVDMEKLSAYLQVSRAKLASKGVASVRSRVVNLAALSPAITVDALSRQLVESFQKVYGLPAREIKPEELPEEDIAARQARFASEGWRFGTRLAFTSSMERRFPWGEAQLQFAVDQGTVGQAAVCSDGLDAAFLEAVARYFAGVPYEKRALMAAAAAIPAANPEQREITESLVRLLETEFE